MTPMELVQRYANSGASESKAGFTLRDQLFRHRRFCEITCSIAELHHYSRTNRASTGIMVVGPAGVGKTTIVSDYLAHFPRHSAGSVTQIPVLVVGTPSSPTVKSLAQAILTAMGDPVPHRGTAEEKTQRIYSFIERCHVEVMFLDEFHHFIFTDVSKHFRHVSDWLKALMNTTPLSLVLVGLQEGEAVVKANPQLCRRFSSVSRLSPFSYEDAEDFNEFRGLLKAFQESLPLPVEVNLHENNLARRFYFGSGGRLDFVRKILEGAVAVAGRAGINTLDLPIYAAGFRNQVWLVDNDRLNPFHHEAQLRPLTRPGEPFESGGYASMIGSPVAHGLGLVSRRKGGSRV
jgi:hypothetical protein